MIHEGGTRNRWPMRLSPFSPLGPSDVEQNLFPAAIRGIDNADVHVAIAPRPLMATIEHYAPDTGHLPLLPQDREQLASYEEALREELAGYLLEHARRERLALLTEPTVAFRTDERLRWASSGSRRGSCARSRSREPEQATSGTR